MKNLVLVLNCGSSSIKSVLIDHKSGQIQISYLAEKLNSSSAQLHIRKGETKGLVNLSCNFTHEGALEALLKDLEERGLHKNIQAVGHRVIHGGEAFKASTLITDTVLQAIEDCIVLAPLHNPANLQGIRLAQRIFPQLPQVAVFDTSFHQTMPRHAYLYGIPLGYHEKYGIRKYGMHGTSYRYVSEEARLFLRGRGKAISTMVIAHLGNGASLCAVLEGQSMDTTMGLTPLEGLIMGTRSGSVDPNIFTFLQENAHMGIKETTQLLNLESGLLGISGVSNDLREITQAAEQGHEQAQLALQMFTYRIAQGIAAMAVATKKIEALVFTGGIGEHSALVRKSVVDQLSILGFVLDDLANESVIEGEISVLSRRGPIVLVIPTNEELMIAKDTARLASL
ncbi:MAG: acetate kinase [Neisseriaceae bacterium]